MNPITEKRAVLYARSAAQSYGDEQYTLPKRQLTEMRAYAERMNMKIMGEFVDEGCSGLNLNRPQLQRALERIGRHACDAFIVPHLARLSRSWQQLPDLLQTLKQHEVTVISLADLEIEGTPTLTERLSAIHAQTASLKNVRRKYSRITKHPPG